MSYLSYKSVDVRFLRSDGILLPSARCLRGIQGRLSGMNQMLREVQLILCIGEYVKARGFCERPRPLVSAP